MLKMLWTGEYDAHWHAYFEENFTLTRAGMNFAKHMFTQVFTDAQEDQDTLAELLQGQDLYLVGYDKVTDALLDRCPDVKLMLCVRDGPEENIDIDACTRHGIPVLFSGGRCAHAVAEFNLLYMLLMARPVLPIWEIMREQGWTKENHNDLNDIDAFATELFRKTLVIIGMGRNGVCLAQKAAALGMRVCGVDPYADPARMRALGVELMSLEQALPQADYVTLLARVTPETEGMFGQAQIDLLKPSCAVINSGRAKLADTDAIFRALETGRIRMAAMDIFDVEPLGHKARAYEFSNDKLIITPHIAGYTQERVPHEYELLKESLDCYLAGKTGFTIKNPEVFQAPAFQSRGGVLFGSCPQQKNVANKA